MPTSGQRSRRSRRSAPRSSDRRWAAASHDLTVHGERSSPLHRDHDPARYYDRRAPALATAPPLAMALAPSPGRGAQRVWIAATLGCTGGQPARHRRRSSEEAQQRSKSPADRVLVRPGKFDPSTPAHRSKIHRVDRGEDAESVSVAASTAGSTLDPPRRPKDQREAGLRGPRRMRRRARPAG